MKKSYIEEFISNIKKIKICGSPLKVVVNDLLIKASQIECNYLIQGYPFSDNIP